MAFQSYTTTGIPYSQSPFQHQEPMATGFSSSFSQVDPAGGGSYLPPFLLGSPVQHSPRRVSRQVNPAEQSSASKAYPSVISRSASRAGGGTMLHTMATSDQHNVVGVGECKAGAAAVSSGGGGGGGGGGGPPIQGLYGAPPPTPAQASTPLASVNTPERRQLSFASLHTGGGRVDLSHTGAATPAAALPITPGTIGSLSTSGLNHKTPPSPPQMDPFYTQGENLTSDDGYHDCWITVFGFPPPAASYILEQFSQYGTILKHTITSSGNWMHILYQSKLQAKKALSKNGKIYGNGIMVGVQPCIDKAVMESYSGPLDGTSEAVCASTAGTGLSTPSNVSSSNRKPTSIRPLTAAYQASSSTHQVAPSNPNAPQKSTGIITRAIEYMFGW